MVNKNIYKTSQDLYSHANGHVTNTHITEMFTSGTPAPTPSPIPPPVTHTPAPHHSSSHPSSHPDKPKTPGPAPTSSTENTVEVQYKTLSFANLGNPEVWGPAMWFSLHNGAARYPERPSPFWRERMKFFILGIPVMVPCENCSNHAAAYIEQKWSVLDDVVGCKNNLFLFFWEMHNYVNERLGKRMVSFDEAYKTYHSKVNVTKLEIK